MSTNAHATFDFACFLKDWPDRRRPESSPWFPFIPPSLAPEERPDRVRIRDYYDDAFGIERKERALYRRYVLGRVTPEECWHIDVLHGFRAWDKAIEAGGLAIAHAQADLLANGLRLDMPTRLLNYRYTNDWEYGTARYVADLKHQGERSGNAGARLFLDLQQQYAAAFLPIMRLREEEAQAGAGMSPQARQNSSREQ